MLYVAEDTGFYRSNMALVADNNSYHNGLVKRSDAFYCTSNTHYRIVYITLICHIFFNCT